MYPDCLHILDYYHAKEHLCGFAEIYFSADTNAKNKWIEEQEKLFLKDEVTTVIKNISALPKSGSKNQILTRGLINYYAKTKTLE